MGRMISLGKYWNLFPFISQFSPGEMSCSPGLLIWDGNHVYFDQGVSITLFLWGFSGPTEVPLKTHHL